MTALKNNKLFQACSPLALVLTFFCSPVFSLDSVNDFESFNAYFSNGEYSGYPVEACFRIGGATGSCISAINNDTLVINFPSPVNMTGFTVITSVPFQAFSIDGVSYRANELVNFSSMENVSTIIFYAFSNQYMWVDSISFDFETVDVVDGGSDNDITQGINWSLFAYSFTVVTFFAMLGRGVKSVIDLIRYG